MNKHNMKLPLSVQGWMSHAETSIMDADGKHVAECSGLNGEHSSMAAVRALRIAACVNACDGINPEHLSELLTALQNHVEYTSGPGHWFTPYRTEILAAFKKVKP